MGQLLLIVYYPRLSINNDTIEVVVIMHNRFTSCVYPPLMNKRYYSEYHERMPLSLHMIYRLLPLVQMHGLLHRVVLDHRQDLARGKQLELVVVLRSIQHLLLTVPRIRIHQVKNLKINIQW